MGSSSAALPAWLQGAVPWGPWGRPCPPAGSAVLGSAPPPSPPEQAAECPCSPRPSCWGWAARRAWLKLSRRPPAVCFGWARRRTGEGGTSLLLAALPCCLCLLAPIRAAAGVLCPCHPCPRRLPCARVCSAQPTRAPGGAPEAVDNTGQAQEGRPSPGSQTCGITWAHPGRGAVLWGSAERPGEQTLGAEPPSEQLLRWGPIPTARPHPGKLPLLSAAGPEPAKRFWGEIRRTLLGTEPPAAPRGLPAQPPPGCRPASRILRSSPSPAGCPPWAPRARAGLRSCHLPLTRWLLGARGRSISSPPAPAASIGDSVGCPLPPAQPLLS